MYVDIIFLCITPIYLRNNFSEPKNRELSEEIKVKKCIIEKSKKTIVNIFLVIFIWSRLKQTNLLTTQFNE